MASGVNVKMGVSGVSQFKQSMNQAKSAVKTLDAQLALSEKQYKQTGDAESYMTEKSELLKAKLEQQKGIVENAEKALEQMTKNGVDRSSKAYQDLYQQMLKAKGELIDTENEMNGVADAGDNAADGVDSMNQQLQRIGEGINYQNVISGIDSITGGLESIISKAWKAGEALVNATLGAGSWADELKTTAAQYDDTLKAMSGGESSVEYLQRMRKTAHQIDTDVDTILSAQDKLKKNREGQGKEYKGTLAYLGITDTGKSDLDLFWEAGEAIAKLGENEDKVEYAQRLFGKSWRELLPLFQEGREGYEEMMNSWNVVSEEQVDNLGKMDDQYNKMQDEWETFKMQLLETFSGPLTEGMETITGLFSELNKYLKTPEGQAMLKQIGDTISGLISDLTKLDPETVVAGFKQVVDDITNALKWIDEHHEDVVKAMEAVAIGWGALKLTGGALRVLEVVNGLKWMKANPNIPISGTGGGTPAGSGTNAIASGGGAAATGGGIAAGIKGFIASNGASILAPFATVAAAVLPAMFAQTANEKEWARQKEERLTAAASMTGGDAAFMRNAAEALDQKYQLTGDSLQALLGLQDRGTVEKARLFSMLSGKFTDSGNNATDELLRLWESGGEGWDQKRTDDLLTTITDNYEQYTKSAERMEQTADDLNGATKEQENAAKEMKEAADKMPGEVASAVTEGISHMSLTLNISGQELGATIEPYVSQASGRRMSGMTY